MLGTVILDTYSADQAGEVAEALDTICPPDSSGPFASAGLYGFWDHASGELLYIGRTNDLGIRFRQHNGLLQCPEAGCKSQQVGTYFERAALMGFTICPQSPIDQPDSARARRQYRDDLEARATLAEQAWPGHEELVDVEGQLIGAHLNRHGSLPPWNRVGGGAYGASRATPHTEPLLDIFRARFKCAMNPSLTLRQLAEHDELWMRESLLHVARFWMASWRGGVSDELLRAEVERLAEGPEWSGACAYRELLSSGYLDAP